MNIETILTVLLRYLPNLSLAKSMSLARELSALNAPSVISYTVPEKALVTWLRGYAQTVPTGYVNEHKIKTIKEMREAFRTPEGSILGLRECKNAVDIYCQTYGYTAF